MRATIFPINFFNNWESELSTFALPHPKAKNAGENVDTRRIMSPLTRLKKEAKSQGPIILRRHLPWTHYRQLLHRDLGGPVMMASSIENPGILVSIKTVLAEDLTKRMTMIQRVKHNAFEEMFAAYCEKREGFLVSKYSPISMNQLCSYPIFPIKSQVKSLVYQVCLAQCISCISC